MSRARALATHVKPLRDVVGAPRRSDGEMALVAPGGPAGEAKVAGMWRGNGAAPVRRRAVDQRTVDLSWPNRILRSSSLVGGRGCGLTLFASA